MQDDIRVSRGASTEVQRDVSQNLGMSVLQTQKPLQS